MIEERLIKPGEDGDHITYCRLCEAQCGLIAAVEDGRIVKIKPDHDHPISKGHLCVKAPGMLEVTYDDDRLLQPMRRAGAPGHFEPVSWDEAISDIADRLGTIVARHGGTSLASYIGNPAAFSTFHYAYGFAFIGMFGSDKIYNAMQVDTGARVLASDQVYGDSGRYPFPDLPDNDFLMIFGGNPLVSHMSLICAPRVREALDGIAARGSVIVVDPRLTETARQYEHQPINPDGDIWLLAGLLKTLLEESLTDEGFLAQRVNGWVNLSAALNEISWSRITTISGIEESGIRNLARRFAASRTAACYGRVGTNRGRFSTLANILMDAMNLATGNFARQGGSVIGRNPFEPREGARRASSYGQKFSRTSGLPLVGNTQPGGGLAAEILTSGAGQIRALFVDSGNPVLSYPDGESLTAALDTLALFVSLDLYMNETNRFADYILPVTSFYERADVNDQWAANAPEPWAQYVDPVIPARGEARHEYDIYDAILAAMGREDPVTYMTGQAAEAGARRSHFEVADRGLRSGRFGDLFGANPDGLTLEKLRTEHPHGLAVAPRVDAERSWEQVTFEDGRVRLWTELIENELIRLKKEPHFSGDHELKLFGRRLLHTMNSWMHNSDKVIRNAQPTLLMHPADAEQRQIQDGSLVRVQNANGLIKVQVEISTDVVQGSVNYPHGFGHNGSWRKANKMAGANVNLLASSDPKDWEPVSGNCHVDGITVEVAPV